MEIWSKPELIVCARNRPEETLSSAMCKTGGQGASDGGTCNSSSNDTGNCYYSPQS